MLRVADRVGRGAQALAQHGRGRRRRARAARAAAHRARHVRYLLPTPLAVTHTLSCTRHARIYTHSHTCTNTASFSVLVQNVVVPIWKRYVFAGKERRP